MRWGIFAGALVVTYVLQTAVIGVLGWSAVDLFLLLALLCGLLGATPDARIAGWIVGLAQDLGSLGHIGVHAVALGLAVFIVTAMRDAVNHGRWSVRMLLGFLGAFPAQLVLIGYMIVWRGEGHPGVSWGALVLLALVTSLLAAFLAALITTHGLFAGRVRGRRRMDALRRPLP